MLGRREYMAGRMLSVFAASQKRVLGKSKGFTLVELLVVIALISIALAIAVPSFTQFSSNLRYREAGRNLASALRQGRSLAVSGNQTVNVAIDTVNKTCQVGSNAAITLPAAATISTTVPLTAGVATVTFNANGSTTLAADSTITILDADGNTRYTITITAISGRVRVT